MKKNITINLFGALYAIDEDACQMLEQYLENMKRYFSKREGGDEIADDIEHRVAEIFAELKREGVEAVSIEQVEQMIHRIGNPEEMDTETETDESLDKQVPPAPPHDTNEKGERTMHFGGRKLFRDPDDHILGGVMAGVCKYFGGTDPLPWRILMIILAFVSILTLGIIYLIAWALIPQARTAEERLQMQGKPINPQTLNEELMRTAGKASDYVTSPKFKSSAHSFLGTLLHIIVVLLKVAALVVIGSLLLGLLTLSGIVVEGIQNDANALWNEHLPENFFGELLSHFPYIVWEFWSIVVAFATVLSIILYLLIRSFIKRSTDKDMNGSTRTALTIICILSLIIGVSFSVLIVTQIGRTEEAVRSEKEHADGYYMELWSREQLAENNWKVLNYRNCNDTGSAAHYIEGFCDEYEYATYMLFEKGSKHEKMAVQIERSENYPEGDYQLEGIGFAVSDGAYLYAKNDSLTMVVAELPRYDMHKNGNMGKMALSELAETAFFNSDIAQKELDDDFYSRLKKWSYVQSDTFHHPGGALTIGITNIPAAVGFSEDAPTTWRFALRDISVTRVM